MDKANVVLTEVTTYELPTYNEYGIRIIPRGKPSLWRRIHIALLNLLMPVEIRILK